MLSVERHPDNRVSAVMSESMMNSERFIETSLQSDLSADLNVSIELFVFGI